MVSPAELKDITKEWFTKQLTFMGIPVPKMLETLHFSVIGSTGSGKTQVIADYIESAHRRADRTITIDPNGGFMANFWKPGDAILNPFDERGKAWTIFNEIKTPYDVEQYAVSLIPKSPSTEQEQWNSMARTVVAEVMLKLARLGRNTTEQLVHWLVVVSNESLQTMLSDTAAAGMFHGAEETLGSVRAVLTRYVTPHKYLSDNKKEEEIFSIRDWLENGTGNLWVTWREDMLPALKPLISCWIDVICASSLSTDVQNATSMHLIIDELDSLEKLNYLVHAATKGRKHELHIFTGIQSYAQLDATNGKDDALTLRNSLRNTASMAIAEMDTYTAEEISKGFGEHEVVRKRETQSRGQTSSGIETVPERLIRTSQIHILPDLTGYMKLAGNIPIARIRMRYKKRKIVTDAFCLADGVWTNKIQPLSRPFGANSNAVV
jgi:type IV secretory pathway TraG/TraD family ATPase VirD4